VVTLPGPAALESPRIQELLQKNLHVLEIKGYRIGLEEVVAIARLAARISEFGI
jgi:hypothetical protein